VVEVRKLAPEPPESDASADDPAERPDNDDL
jgi:DNA polymerase III subunit gamma/tau